MKSSDNKPSIVMVGDSAWVGETIIKYASNNFSFKHIKRSRKIWSKTLGIAAKILLSHGDLYHVHYGLQDHYLVKRFKKSPSICHFHGSDLRESLRGKWGWIVRSNLEEADKVLVGVPDILDHALSYRDDAQYVPNPVDLRLFEHTPVRENDTLNILLSADLSLVKGVDLFLESYAIFQSRFPRSQLTALDYGRDRDILTQKMRELRIRARILSPVRHNDMPRIYRQADIVATDFRLGYLQMTSLESMASGRPVIQLLDEKFYREIEVPPVLKVSNSDEIVAGLWSLTNLEERKRIANLQKSYVEKYHNPFKIAERYLAIYRELLTQ